MLQGLPGLVFLGGTLIAADSRFQPCTSAADCEAVSTKLRERTGSGLRLSATDRSLPPGVAGTDDLTVEEAVAVALWNNTGFQAALAALGIARAEVIDASLLRNFGLQVLFPVGPKPFESVLEAPIEALWQRPRRVAAARANLSQVTEALVQNGLNLMRDVRLACADLELAEKRERILAETADLRGRIAGLTDKRLEAGDISEMEARLPRIDARSAADVAMRSRDDTRLTRDRLRLLLGLEKDTSALRMKMPELPAAAAAEWPALLEAAVSSRPDMRAAELAVEAATLRAKWERSRILTVLSALLSVKGVGDAGIRAGPGVQTQLPIFNRNQGSIARADAEVHRAAIAYVALRDDVELEVRRARTEYVQALESLQRVREAILPAVHDSVKLAERAYTDGDASYLFVLEASRQLYDVEILEAQEAAALRRAAANGEHAIGRKW